MTLPDRYHEWILWIGDGTGLPDAILHIHAGLAILLIVRLISRRSLATFVPFLVVVLAEAGNEFMDYLVYGMRWDDTLSDIGNTLFWPLVLSLGLRLRPMIVPIPSGKTTDSRAEAYQEPTATDSGER